MTYVKTDWSTGDIITAEKLNNIEDGIANAESCIITNVTATWDATHDTYSDVALDMTAEEIYEAITGGKMVFASYERGEGGDVILMPFQTLRYIEGDEEYECYANSVALYPTPSNQMASADAWNLSVFDNNAELVHSEMNLAIAS